MKILYLLFVVLFLVAQVSVEGRRCPPPPVPWRSRWRCIIRGGSCHFQRCPPSTIRIGRCGWWCICCRRI
ncbi:gallinacin-2-like [Carettochelys insculpta]|uniref:gallinacin-2-like n=1 Tax=Carettochelys insculpta TaxID=44489 RepID=UPI003EB8F48F